MGLLVNAMEMLVGTGGVPLHTTPVQTVGLQGSLPAAQLERLEGQAVAD